MPKPKVILSEDLLRYFYVDQKMSGLEAARQLRIGRSTLSRYLKKFGIPERNISEVRQTTKWGHDDEFKKNLSERMRAMPKGKDSPYWKGGRYIDDWGYVRVNIDGKYLKEHRYVMEQHLGRKLERTEHVHHLNHDKEDNALNNLELLSASDHLKKHWDDAEWIRNHSDKIKKVRSEKYWSSNKKKV